MKSGKRSNISRRSLATTPTESKTPFTRTKTHNSGSKSPVTRSKTPVYGSKTSPTGSKTPLKGSKTPLTGSKSPLTGSNTPLTGSKTPLTDSKSLLSEANEEQNFNKEDESCSELWEEGMGKKESLFSELVLSSDDPPTAITDEEAYDTDLEKEEENVKSYKSVTAEDLYYKACEQLGVVPVTYFVTHMQDEIINMSHHGLGPNGARAIAAPLVVNTSVLELNLEDNWVTADGMKDIGDMLVENCYISILNLAGNKLGASGARLVGIMIKENTNLRELNVARNEFKDADAKHFAESLKSNFRLKVLNLSGNSFCEEGGEWMGQAIAHNEAIEHLNLSWNHLRRKGALAICAGMKANITIKFLDLCWNGFCDDGAMAMGMALRNNNTLIWLDLSNNRISDKGAAMLAKGLEVNDTLKTLKIGNNPIGNDGAMSLIRAITKNHNSAIEDFDVKGVQVHEDFLRAVQDLKKKSVEASGSRTNFFLHINAVDVSAPNRKKYSSLIGVHDPMEVIQKFLEDKRLRLVDLFRNFDKDLSWKISPGEFKKGIENAGVPLTKLQLKTLMRGLDVDRDGQVNYRELFAGKKAAIQRRRARMKREQQEKEKEKAKGKSLWAAWENALQLTSSVTNLNTPKPETDLLQSRSLVLPGRRRTRNKSTTTQSSAKSNEMTTTPRLIKSFVGQSSSLSRDALLPSHIAPRPAELFADSAVSFENIRSDEESSCANFSIRVPLSDRSVNEKKLFLSTGEATPRRTGGIPNSRKRP